MDYLISEGYPRAAERFAKEANIQLPLDEDSIESRVEIRQAIHAGDIDTAVTKINDLNPQVSFATCFTHLPHLQDYNQFHAPRIISLMIIKPSVLSMIASTHTLFTKHIALPSFANKCIRSLTPMLHCILLCFGCN